MLVNLQIQQLQTQFHQASYFNKQKVGRFSIFGIFSLNLNCATEINQSLAAQWTVVQIVQPEGCSSIQLMLGIASTP